MIIGSNPAPLKADLEPRRSTKVGCAQALEPAMNQTLFLPPTTLPTDPLSTPGPVLEDLLERAQDYADASLAANTKKAYACDWVHFRAWCEGRGLCPLPATVATLIAYLTDQADAGSKVSTLRRRVVSIRY